MSYFQLSPLPEVLLYKSPALSSDGHTVAIHYVYIWPCWCLLATLLHHSACLFSFLHQEYVDLYTDWLLNKSIARSFDAFKRGFDLVMSHTFIADLFTAEEVEQLICGCNVSI